MAGGSWSDGSSGAWVGRTAPLPGQSFGDGWTWNLFADHFRYEYASGPRWIDGRSSAIKAGLGREMALAHGTLVAGGGVTLRHVDTSPHDPGNDADGTHARPVVDLQWRSHPGAGIVTQGFGQYVGGARSHYAAVFAGPSLPDGTALGLQASSGGDPTYRQYGLALSWRGLRLADFELGIHLGGRHQEGLDTEAEAGLTLVLYRP